MIRELRTFVAITRYGTLARTATRIGLTQSAISAQIHRLEDQLGFELFDRSGRSSKLTSSGLRTLERAEKLLALYEQLGAPDGQPDDGGIVRVGAIASVQTSYLINVLIEFRRDLPGWGVRVVPGVSTNLLGLLDLSEIDLAVMIRPPFALPAEFSWTPLSSERFVLIVPRRDPQRNWRDILETEPFIRYDRQSFGGRTVDRFLRNHRLPVNETLELDELITIRELVARGMGVAIVPEDTVADAKLDLMSIMIDDQLTREIGLIQRDAGSLSSGAGALSKLIVKHARDAATTG